MKLTITDLADGAWIPERFAFGAHDPASGIRLSDNINPALSWGGLPDATKSLVLICVDDCAPSVGDDVNRAGRTVPADLARAEFFHWVMVDIPPSCRGIAEGECSSGITPHGKRSPHGPAGSRQGLNDYTGWFAGDGEMSGRYFGYDGPCPPWNDALVHRYTFELTATDLARCPVEGAFTANDVRAAIAGHVLATARVTGRYAINPDAR